MKRKIFSWMLIIFSSLFLLLSAVGILATWILNKPFEREVLRRLDSIDSELALGQTTLTVAQQELERALNIVNATEKALNEFTQNDPRAFFEDVHTTLDDQLIPELETAKDRLINARNTLENVRVVVFGLNIVPFISISIPDKTLTDLIDSADSLQTQIGDVSDLAEQASGFLDSASQLFNGDFSETHKSLEGFLSDVTAYQQKVTGWREQIADIKNNLSLWIGIASITLTFFLFWFGLSQFSLILHGRTILRGENPWEVLYSPAAKD